MKKLFLPFFVFLLGLSIVHAVNVTDDVYINTTVTDYHIFVNHSLTDFTFDELIVTNYSIEIYNLSSDTRFDALTDSVVNFYGLNNALFYNTNLSVPLELSDINSNDNNINLTVGGLQAFYVLDNYSVIEGIEREFSPLWFSSSSSVSKSIASNLTDTINASVSVNFSDYCSLGILGKLNYTSHSGAYSEVWDAGSFVCEPDGFVTLNITGLEFASGSNGINASSYPSFEPMSSFSLNEDFGSYEFSILGNVSDLEDDDSILTYNWSLSNGNIVLGVVNETGIVTFSSVGNATGTIDVIISVVDSSYLSNSSSFTVTLNAVDDAPWADALPDSTVVEDTGSFFAWLWSVIVSVWHDVEDLFPSSVEIVSQSNESVVSCSLEEVITLNTTFTTSPILLYNFDGNLLDSSGNGFNATAVGTVTFVDNLYLGGSVLDNNSYVSASDAAFVDPSLVSCSNCSIDYWVKPNFSELGIDKGGVDTSAGDFYNFTVYRNTAGVEDLYIGINASGGCWLWVQSTNQIYNVTRCNNDALLVDGVWNRMTLTWDWAVQTARLLINDTVVAELTGVSAPAHAPEGYTNIGSRWQGESGGTGPNTLFDNFTVYNESLINNQALTSNVSVVCVTEANISGVSVINLSMSDSSGQATSTLGNVIVESVNDPPFVEWSSESPSNGSYWNSDVIFYFNVSDIDTQVLDNCTLWKDSALVDSVYNIGSGVNSSFQYNVSVNESVSYSFQMGCFDGTNETLSSSKNVIVDYFLPIVDWISPLPDNSSVFTIEPVTFVSFDINISDKFLDFVNVTIRNENGVAYVNNYSSSVGSELDFAEGYSFQLYDNGTYYVEVLASDLAGNSVSESRAFYILDVSEIIGVSSFVDTSQYPMQSHFYELNLTFNNGTILSFSGTLNWSNLTTALTYELVNSSLGRLYVNYVTPFGYDNIFIPYSFDVYVAFANGSITENQTISTGTISVSSPTLVLCNDSVNDDYQVFTFIDETTNSSLNGIISFSSFYYSPVASLASYYYYGFTSVANASYSLCYEPSGQELFVNEILTYSASGYPSRSYSKDGTALTSVVTETVLPLLASGSGAVVTFQVVDSVYGSAISDVNVLAEKNMGSYYLNVGNAVTDGSGVVTFFLDTMQPHRFTFTKSGYTSRVETYDSLSSSAPYTIALTSSESSASAVLLGSNASYHSGISYWVEPNASVLYNNTDYNFSFDISSNGYYTLSEAGFNLFNSTGMNENDIIGSAVCYGNVSCSASVVVNTGNFSWVVMNFYWISNDSFSNDSRLWTVMWQHEGRFSISRFVTDVQRFGDYFDSPVDEDGHNLNFEFTKAIISLVVILLIVGSLTYFGGVYSPLAILGVVASVVTLLDVTNFLPATVTVFGANLLTIIVWLFVGGYYVSSRVVGQ